MFGSERTRPDTSGAPPEVRIDIRSGPPDPALG